MIKYLIILILSILFIGCNNSSAINNSMEIEYKNIVSEYSLSTKAVSSVNENHIVMLELETGLETTQLENDLDERGSDCYNFVPITNLDEITIIIDDNMPIEYISIQDETTNSLDYFYKGKADKYSFIKKDSYQVCVHHNGIDESQTVFLQFGSSLDDSCNPTTADNVIDSLNTGSCKGCTLTNDVIKELKTKKLRNIDLTCATLKGVNFSNYHLENTIFDKVKFFSIKDTSDFPDVKYTNTTFDSSYLDNASFKNVEFIDINKASPLDINALFRNAVLNGVDFSSSIFTFTKDECIDGSVSFENNTFKNAQMQNLCFKPVDSKAISLQGVNFEGANLQNADLSEIDFGTASFIQANLTGVDFYNSNLTNTNFSNTTFISTDLSNADFTNANMQNTSFDSVTLLNTNFTNADFTNTTTEQLSKIAKKDLVDLTNAKQSVIAWGYSGKPSGEWTDCTNWNEGTNTTLYSFDAGYWDDNYLCTKELGTWYFYDNGDHNKTPKVRLLENSDTSWDDNYLIYTNIYNINIYFSSDGYIPKKFCVNTAEPSDSSNTWGDNFICFDFN
ncbi:pentapeptide repeat-containing protein [Halarcobacter sp.]|uniref:pentapeptide repeat-containing protein n=1 Tax=Halarcobacter sp. TaxID=2321133 RepID=UPI002AA8D1D3|nr:pentapeptide repeat-containing protein [Halarcobacter sp.]